MTIFHYIFIPEKEENPGILTTWMELEGVALSEISQKEKGKCCVHGITYMRKLEKKKEAKLTEIESRKVVARGWGK